MAEKVANNILIENNKSNYFIDSYILDSENKIDNFYIFQFYPKGFVLVSANEGSIPIIGYSFKN